MGAVSAAQVGQSQILQILQHLFERPDLVASLLFHERELALRLLRDNDHTFTDAFKTELRKAYVDVLRLPADGDDAAKQAMFNC